MRHLASILLFGALIAFPPLVFAQEATGTGSRLDVAEALRTALKKNPSFAESGLVVREARLDAEAQHDYLPWTLGAEAGVRYDEQPTSGVIETGVRRSTNVDGSVELLKQFVVGTRLSARLDLYRSFAEVPFQVADFGIDETREIGPNYGGALTVSVNQPLLRGFGTDIGALPIDAAEQQLDAAKLQRERAAADLVVSVLEAYWEWVRADLELQARRDSLERTKRLADATLAQIEAGRLAELERDLVARRISAAEQGILLAEVAVEDARDGLVEVLGVAMGEAPGWEPSTNLPDDPATVPPVDALVDSATQASPDVRLLEQDVEAARLALRRSEDATLPQLDAVANLTQLALSEEVPDALEQLATLDFTGIFVGLVFRMPLDNDLAEKQLAADEVALRRAELRKTSAVRQIERRVRQARRLLVVQQESLELSREEVELARKNLDAMQDKFDAGLASNLEVLDVEEELEDAELRLQQTRIDLVLARVNLQRLTGTLLDVYGVEVQD